MACIVLRIHDVDGHARVEVCSDTSIRADVPLTPAQNVAAHVLDAVYLAIQDEGHVVKEEGLRALADQLMGVIR